MLAIGHRIIIWNYVTYLPNILYIHLPTNGYLKILLDILPLHHRVIIKCWILPALHKFPLRYKEARFLGSVSMSPNFLRFSVRKTSFRTFKSNAIFHRFPLAASLLYDNSDSEYFWPCEWKAESLDRWLLQYFHFQSRNEYLLSVK